jgi:hypothetical protein
LNKNQEVAAAYRMLGSIGFSAAARAVWLVQEDKEDKERRLFVPAKGNLSRNPTGLAYRLMSRSIQTKAGLTDSAYCAFEPELLSLTADDLLAVLGRGTGRPRKKDDAAEWLQAFLEDGPKEAGEIYRAAEEAGFKERTIERAKTKLYVQSIRMVGESLGGGHWEWALPT